MERQYCISVCVRWVNIHVYSTILFLNQHTAMGTPKTAQPVCLLSFLELSGSSQWQATILVNRISCGLTYILHHSILFLNQFEATGKLVGACPAFLSVFPMLSDAFHIKGQYSTSTHFRLIRICIEQWHIIPNPIYSHRNTKHTLFNIPIFFPGLSGQWEKHHAHSCG